MSSRGTTKDIIQIVLIKSYFLLGELRMMLFVKLLIEERKRKGKEKSFSTLFIFT